MLKGLRMGENGAFIKLGAFILAITGALAVSLSPGRGAADGLEGVKSVRLITGAGAELVIGTIRFTSNSDNSNYTLALDDAKFSEHFLSMRPFKCIEGAEQTVCYLPYPHALRRQVSAGDLTDLEYDLLFLHKAKGEYGINFWNGIYYDLALSPDGTIKGTLKVTDMNELASPPAEKFGRLIGPDSLSDADAAYHRYPTLVIR